MTHVLEVDDTRLPTNVRHSSDVFKLTCKLDLGRKTEGEGDSEDADEDKKDGAHQCTAFAVFAIAAIAALTSRYALR